MIELSRTVRFCLGGDGSLAVDAPVHNSFASWPPMRGLGRYYEIEVACTGRPDPVTGYLVNIKEIDLAVRRQALPCIAGAARGAGEVPLGRLLQRLLERLGPALAGQVSCIRLKLTPFHSLQIASGDMDHVLLTHEYEFSAAHRLHSAELSEAENRRIYGKCNNPGGHGHNYRLEVTARAPIDAAGRVLRVEALDRVVDEQVIQRLDHKNLDDDVPQFASVNSSVEQIARVVFEMLAGPVGQLGVELVEVRVWETGKTACAYRGPAPMEAGGSAATAGRAVSSGSR